MEKNECINYIDLSIKSTHSALLTCGRTEALQASSGVSAGQGPRVALTRAGYSFVALTCVCGSSRAAHCLHPTGVQYRNLYNKKHIVLGHNQYVTYR